MKKSDININEAVKIYKKEGSLHKTAKILHTSHIRLSNLFKDNNIKIENIGKKRDIFIDDENMVKTLYMQGKTISEISKDMHITVKNISKILKKLNIPTGRWHNYEKPIKNKSPKKVKEVKPQKKCPYCEWYTTDINNHSHSYAKHILQHHKMTIEDHLNNYPDDYFYFEKIINRRKGKIQCNVCGKFLSLIDERHLRKHNLTKAQYVELYGDDNLVSNSCKEKLHKCIEQMYNNPNWVRNSSTYEKSLQDFLRENNLFYTTHNRKIVSPLELDIFIPSLNIAIEFNGNKYHTEWFGGKTRMYHLNKTRLCQKNHIKLIHIFEDEYVYKKDIVFNKLSHILNLQQDLPKIMGRKCKIKEVIKSEAETFLNTYHIQGYDPSTIHYGAYYNNELIAVMSFMKTRKNENDWELTRFASNFHYVCQGVGGKLFKHFIREHNPNTVKSFADRRWTINEENNLYKQLGFKFVSYTNPDYKYYNTNVDKYKRWHKFGFRKQILLKKYPDKLDKNMTEREMVKALGYDRIWDCGLIKYVWSKN